MKTFKTTSNWIIYGRQEGKFTSIELKEGEVFSVEESPKGNAIIHKNGELPLKIAKGSDSSGVSYKNLIKFDFLKEVC